jgi:hypothetical protein
VSNAIPPANTRDQLKKRSLLFSTATKALALALPLLAAAALSRCNREQPVNESPWLTIRAGRVVNEASGAAVTLRGVNVDMFYYSQPWQPEIVWNYFDEWSAGRLAADGATLVRLAFHWHTLAEVEPQVRLKAEALDRYKRIVGWLAARHIYVVLDMHVPPGNDDIDPGSGAFWRDARNAANLVAIWKLLAAAFKDEPYVLGYDVFNEPSPPAAADWWRLLDDAINAIRQADARHLIVVEPPWVENDSGFRQVADPLALYEVHFYEPFAVSHRGADWLGDTAVPTDGIYPGNALVDLEWLAGADPTLTVTGASGWREVNALDVTVPSGAAYAAVTFFGWGDTDCLFDDAAAVRNGAAVGLVNPGIGQASPNDAERPKAWFHYSASGFTFEWVKNDGHAGPGALRIRGNGEWAVWQQLEWAVLTRPLIKVAPGDRLSVRAYAKPRGMSGSAGVTVDFFKPIYKYYDRGALEQEVMASGVAWLRERNLPVYIGEFGGMATDADATATAYIRDLTGIFNALALPWTLWTFRDNGGPEEFGFGIMRCGPESLPAACQTFRPSVYLPWQAALRE